mgnify:CR=1 FL=1
MFVIVVYDVDEKRVNIVNKYLKRYLFWVQNSVFEGDISKDLMDRMINGLEKILKDNDSAVIYVFNGFKVERKVLGRTRGFIDNIL